MDAIWDYYIQQKSNTTATKKNDDDKMLYYIQSKTKQKFNKKKKSRRKLYIKWNLFRQNFKFDYCHSNVNIIHVNEWECVDYICKYQLRMNADTANNEIK